MTKLGIDMEESCWTLPARASYSRVRKFDWPTLLRPLTGCMSANPQLGSVLRWLSACWLTGCGGEFPPVHPHTVRNRLISVRQLLLPVLANDKSLEAVTPRQAQNALRALYFHDAQCTVKRTTLRQTLYAIHDLYRLRAYLPTSFVLDPFPPLFVQQTLAFGSHSDPWVAPPEPVCLELIRQAIRLLGTPAEDIIRLRDKYILACESLRRRERRARVVRILASRTLHGERFAVLEGEDAPWTQLSAESPRDIKRLVEALEGACAIVLLFLSGPRVSEIQRAGPGCLRYLRHANGISYPYYFAQRSKQGRWQSDTAHRYRLDAQNRGWILGPAGVRALQVLDKLSRRVRAIAKSNSYWASPQCCALWFVSERTLFTAATPRRINPKLNAFAQLIGLAERTGWSGRLHSHMGRKACARFIAKRDRTALADLAVQFGHLSAYVTDVGYARPDAEYRRLIDDELAAEMYEVATDLAALDVERTFSNLEDSKLLQLRERATDFVGQLRSTVDIRRMLGKGVRLVPCDWGMCVYREETSACRGNQFGPSSERRSPVVCRTCINFVSTEKHQPFWQRRVDDCRRVLQHRGLPEQTMKLVQLRLSEALEVLASLSNGEASDELRRAGSKNT